MNTVAVNTVAAAVAAALAQAPGALFVGFSGGLDSTVLLHAVAARRRDGVVAVHVDHGIHPESSAWCERCARTAQRFDVRFVARCLDVAPGSGLEARARQARYDVFRELLAASDARLLLAHHSDDQVETGLLRLLQGRGLYGMPQSRRLAAGQVVRPLLSLPRSVLRDYAVEHGLDWIDDPGNLDLTMDRNFLRERLLPALRGRWPGIDAALLDAMGLRREADLLAAAGVGLDAARLPVAALDGDVGMTRLRLWLAHQAVALPTRAALQEFLRQTREAAADRTPRLAVGDGHALIRYDGWVYLRRPAPRLGESYPVDVPGRLELPHGELRVEPASSGVRAEAPLSVRFRRGGERLRCGGRARAVKQLLREARVPPWARDSYPLVWDARGLLALPGIAVRDAAVPEGPSYRLRWLPQ